MKHSVTRREFIAKTVLATGATATVLGAQAQVSGIPKRVLGRTGVEVPILGFGSGSRFCNAYKDKDDEAVAALHHAVDLGVTYFDTSDSYGKGFAERMMGQVLKSRRKEVCIATKLYGGKRDDIMRQIEETLKRLQTDHVDLLHIHKLENDDEVESLGQKGGSVEAYYALREQKVARFIGVTAHFDPLPLKHFIGRYDFDCTQFVLNAALQGVVPYKGGYKPSPASRQSFETIALPAALEKGMGVLAMKTLGQGHLIGADADARTLLRYAWSLPIASAMVGMTSQHEIAQNVACACAFKPMPKDEMKTLSSKLAATHKAALDRRFAHHDDCC